LHQRHGRHSGARGAARRPITLALRGRHSAGALLSPCLVCHHLHAGQEGMCAPITREDDSWLLAHGRKRWKTVRGCRTKWRLYAFLFLPIIPSHCSTLPLFANCAHRILARRGLWGNLARFTACGETAGYLLGRYLTPVLHITDVPLRTPPYAAIWRFLRLYYGRHTPGGVSAMPGDSDIIPHRPERYLSTG